MIDKGFDAVYENGVLRPLSPLSLNEGDRVRVSIAQEDELHPSLDELIYAVKSSSKQELGPLEAYETARQLQNFIDQTRKDNE